MLQGMFRPNWQVREETRPMEMHEILDAIRRVYERNGFMRLNMVPDTIFLDEVMGRRVDPGDHPAAPGDVAMVPPHPPGSDHSTPSPRRRRRYRDGSMEPDVGSSSTRSNPGSLPDYRSSSGDGDTPGGKPLGGNPFEGKPLGVGGKPMGGEPRQKTPQEMPQDPPIDLLSDLWKTPQGTPRGTQQETPQDIPQDSPIDPVLFEMWKTPQGKPQGKP